MIISDNLKFIFIHNPRCAGMSIRTALQSLDTSNNYFSGYIHAEGKQLALMHLPMEQVMNYYPEVYDAMDHYFTFMVVRDPITRFVSAFNRLHDKEYEGYLNFSKTYRDSLNGFIFTFNPENLDNFTYQYRHFYRQRDMAYIGESCYADKIIRFESLKSDLEHMVWLNFPLHLALRPLKHLNARPVREPVTELLTNHSIDKIRSWYEKDFETFGYAC